VIQGTQDHLADEMGRSCQNRGAERGAASFTADCMAERFIKVAEGDELPPGKMGRVEIERRRILLAKVRGHFYATDDTCSHEDASLSTGFL